MNKKSVKILFVCFAIVVLLNVSCTDSFFLGSCENFAEKEAVSPNGNLRAVIFNRGCGTTVGFITGISIVAVNEKIQNTDTGNILFAENVYREFSTDVNGKTQYGRINFDVKWVSNSELKVYFTESKILSKNGDLGNIKVEYELIK